MSTRWSSLTSTPTSDWIVSSNVHKVNTFLTVYVHYTWICLFRAKSIILEGLKFKGGLDIITSPYVILLIESATFWSSAIVAFPKRVILSRLDCISLQVHFSTISWWSMTVHLTASTLSSMTNQMVHPIWKEWKLQIINKTLTPSALEEATNVRWSCLCTWDFN